MQIAWKIEREPSAVYTAMCISIHQRPLPAFLTEAFSETSKQLHDELPTPSAWLPLYNRTFREKTTATNGRKTILETLETLHDLYATAIPDFAEQTRLRLGPLVQQWEAYGPGLIRHCLEAAGLPQGTPPELEITPVLPMFGGGGLLLSEGALIEAVLANSNPLLPEVLRLAWLVVAQTARKVGVSPGAEIIEHTIAAGCDMGLTARVEEATAAAKQDWLRFEATS